MGIKEVSEHLEKLNAIADELAEEGQKYRDGEITQEEYDLICQDLNIKQNALIEERDKKRKLSEEEQNV